MARSSYEAELDLLPETYADAMSRDISKLRSAVAAAGISSVVGVGSGGSFTVASLLCSLHEAYAGRVSRASTPLEIICNPTLASTSPVFLVSAEGKNPDILEGLRRARNQSSRPIHVITNRVKSPLAELSRELADVSLHAFDLSTKDGYLATNSLLFDAVVIARAYGGFDSSRPSLPDHLDELLGPSTPLGPQLEQLKAFASIVAGRGSVIVLYSPQLRALAIDLESKLAEAALVHCQLADLRSFAHGRHLWLSKRPEDCAVIVFTEPTLRLLWDATKTLLPTSVPALTVALEGSSPADLIAGLVVEMQFVHLISQAQNTDPANPTVAGFGRSMHYIDVPALIDKPVSTMNERETSKYAILGANWASYPRGGAMIRAMNKYQDEVSKQTFRAVVFDYDGTLCSSQGADAPPSELVVEHIERLVKHGVKVGVASGRGGSIQEYFVKHLPSCAVDVTLGLYNGGWIGTANEPPLPQAEKNEFISHVTRISRRLQDSGVPIAAIRTTQPFQVSLRLMEGVDAAQIWFVIADALRHEGLDILRVVRSKHSVDILSPMVTKSRVPRHLIQECQIDPYEILTFGDHGAWPGNDSSLLEHRFSLSVDQPLAFTGPGVESRADKQA